MSVDIAKLNSRVAALEAALSLRAEEKVEEVVDDRKEVASEIEALERKLSAMSGEESPRHSVAAEDDKKEEVKEEVKAADETKVEEKEEVKEEKKASLVDPQGVEEKITQDYLSEVEGVEHGEELTTGDSTLDVAPTRYVARLMEASARLDVVADYLEKHGKQEMAFRVDKISDAIDARIAKIEGRK